ncbi:DUF6427 family protein [Yeosuana sp. MJ-SS3]|uniref:DUF6427 family protein n=1 Tax=Gilvirhabdus luticola TaxID=3079858 RepID=A0ABU3U2K5_9FLAO|nr:DUF6427 family protein [Yeosuana sp. MJ-SS3]MDU8884632.1 DUF6427 family protein [Yeosuana sp. MJ-SS3]
MITSIFSKSKPINFIVVFFISLFAYVIANFKLSNEVYNFNDILEKIVIFGVCYFSILTLNFIVGKNSLTQKNNYEILLYSLFLLMLPKSLLSDKIIVSNFFILLALRRTLSLRSQINLKKKLFDASFWVAIASLFYFWAILFFILIYAVLLLFTDNKIKNWIVPFTGLLTVLLIVVSYSIIVNGDFFGAIKIASDISIDYSNFNSSKDIIAITILLSFGVWSSIFYLASIRKRMKKFRPIFKSIFISLAIAFVIMIIAPDKNGSEFLFLFPTLAIVVANYIETIKEKWFREIFLLILIISPIVLLIL